MRNPPSPRLRPQLASGHRCYRYGPRRAGLAVAELSGRWFMAKTNMWPVSGRCHFALTFLGNIRWHNRMRAQQRAQDQPGSRT